MVNDTMGEEKNVTYSTHCNTIRADEITTPFFAGATNCTKDFMAVSRRMGVLEILLRGLQGGMAVSWNCMAGICRKMGKAPASFREVCWLHVHLGMATSSLKS